MNEVLIVIGVLLAGLIGFEVLARVTKIPQSLMRKVIHVGMCLIVIGFTFLFDYKVMIGAGMFFVALLIIARKVFKFHSLRDRHDESWGEIFFPLGVSLAALIAPTQMIFIAAILILAFSDTIAYIVGKKYPKSRRIVPNRTIAGSGAGFLVTLVVLLALQFPLGASLLTAVAVAVAEILSKRGLDNVAMPVAAVIVLALLIN